MAVGGGLLFCYTLQIVGMCSDEAFARARSGDAVVTQGSYQEVTAASERKARTHAHTHTHARTHTHTHTRFRQAELS